MIPRSLVHVQLIRSTSAPRPTVGHRTALQRDMYDRVTLATCDRMWPLVWPPELNVPSMHRPHLGRACMHWLTLVLLCDLTRSDRGTGCERCSAKQMSELYCMMTTLSSGHGRGRSTRTPTLAVTGLRAAANAVEGTPQLARWFCDRSILSTQTYFRHSHA